jgi:hypothetical protein
MLRVTSRDRISWLVALAVIVSAGCVLSAQSPQTVVVKPGQDIQEIVENAPQGTRFRFEPGVYRQQTIYPKDRQEFIGQDGVILSGAMELKSWTSESGLWQHEDLPQALPFHGECEDGGDLCKLREDLFVNGRLYARAASLDELGPRAWYYENRRAYLADDPTGQSVELGVTPLAFGGDAEDVVLQDLIIEKYAPDSQHGAIYIDNARGWRLSNVTARWNHGAGLSFGPETLVKGGSFSHNGQVGILGIGEGARIEGVEIAFNNYAGYDAKWEAGGTKFWRNKRLVVQNSCVHHNNGPGLWSDIDNVGVVFDGNKVFMNADDGIKVEISYGAVIRNNIVAYNGTSGFDDWLWGSQILIQNSSNVRVYGNLVEVSSKFGNGVGVIHQDRGNGAYGPWNAVNNLIEHNTIVHLGSRGESGIVTDTDDEDWFWKEADNRFDRNTYIVADGGSEYWTSKEGSEVWDDLRNLSFERNGELIVEQRAPMELSCDR